MLRKVGFFHFGGEDKKRPVKSLRISLEEAVREQPLRGSLIVLPEAFNIETEYQKNCGPYNSDPEIKRYLRDLAVEFELAFVAGLIIKDNDRPGLPYNSAYLITGTSSEPELLSRKMGNDGMGAGNDPMAGGIHQEKIYRPYEEAEAPDALAEYEHTCIAALLCMDATAFPRHGISNRERHMALRDRIAKHVAACSILCVPAYTRYFSTHGIADEWPDLHFVLANGCPLPNATPQSPGYFPSVVRIKGQKLQRFQEPRNKIIVAPLDPQDR